MSISYDTWTWHTRLEHANFELMNDLCKNKLVIGLPKLKFNKDKPCDAYKKEKQSKSSFKLKNIVSTSRPLELIHINLFSPTRVASLGGMHYAYVLADDYSRYTWVCFLAHKMILSKLLKILQKEFKKKKVFVFQQFGVIMEPNLKMNSLKSFVIKMLFHIHFLLLELLNKMGQLK